MGESLIVNMTKSVLYIHQDTMLFLSSGFPPLFCRPCWQFGGWCFQHTISTPSHWRKMTVNDEPRTETTKFSSMPLLPEAKSSRTKINVNSTRRSGSEEHTKWHANIQTHIRFRYIWKNDNDKPTWKEKSSSTGRSWCYWSLWTTIVHSANTTCRYKTTVTLRRKIKTLTLLNLYGKE